MKPVNAVFSPHRQRTMGVILAILLQLVIFGIILRFFSTYSVYLLWLGFLLSAVVALYVSSRKTKLAYKMAWLVPILLAPLLGGIIYLILGGARQLNYPKKESTHTFKTQLDTHLDTTQLLYYGSDAAQQACYLQQAAHFPAYQNTETQYFSSGKAFFPVFLEELRHAEHYIFLEYFIIAEGSLWSEVLEILKQKASEGVLVRIMYDGVGSASTLPAHYPDRLREYGIECKVFEPFRPILSIHQNNRDHRKLAVIDGTTGFVSGLNLADEYIDRLDRFGYWKDNALLLRGEAVWSLAVFFLNMWKHHTTQAEYACFRPKLFPTFEGQGLVLPYADTPLDEDTVCADLHLQMITKAKRYLYLTTPYLVIDETICAALCIVARSGVDVRIMTPHIPDKKVVFAVTRSNYKTLLEAGARIYEFTPGFLHSKTVVADDLYASVGSCNLDYRSFYLQFENGVWLCGNPAVLDVRDDFRDTMEVCSEITIHDRLRASPLQRLLCLIYRIFSPLF